MHRVFKGEFGQNIYESIKSIRLQKSSSLLLTNKNSTISQIAKMCGYSSQGAFIKVFKQKFHMTPKEWRNGGFKKFCDEILLKSKTAQKSNMDFSILNPKIVKLKPKYAYYIRHKGYNKNIKSTWQKLHAWSLCNDINSYEQMGIHHDNPTITPLNECRYIACIITDEKPKNQNIPTLKTPSGVYAKFDFEGIYGDVLRFLNWAYFTWIIKSGFETSTSPSFAIYEKNHFLREDESFKVKYYIPINI